MTNPMVAAAKFNEIRESAARVRESYQRAQEKDTQHGYLHFYTEMFSELVRSTTQSHNDAIQTLFGETAQTLRARVHCNGNLGASVAIMSDDGDSLLISVSFLSKEELMAGVMENRPVATA